jgi:hypothetical protein
MKTAKYAINFGGDDDFFVTYTYLLIREMNTQYIEYSHISFPYHPLPVPNVYRLVWATELSRAAIGLVFPALVLGYNFFIVKRMTYQILYRLKNLYDYCWQQ